MVVDHNFNSPLTRARTYSTTRDFRIASNKMKRQEDMPPPAAKVRSCPTGRGMQDSSKADTARARLA
jgi:hypothetical protein